MDFQTLGSRVSLLLRGTPGSVGLYTSAQLSAVINDANLEVCKDTSYIKGTGSVYTVAGTYQYALSASYMCPSLLSIYEVRYNGNILDQSGVGDAYWHDKDDKTTNAQGTPLRYRVFNGNLELDPVPDSVKELRVYHSKKPATLVDATATPEVPSEYHMAMVFYACSLLSTADEKEARYGTFYAKYVNEIMRLRQMQNGFGRETIPLDPAVVSARRH